MKNKQKIFITADHHFNHFNIIQYCNRPYDTVDEMNQDMIKKWNEVVNNEDVIYHLGDFGFEKGPTPIEEIFSQLNGTIHLVKGNHDTNKMINKCNFKTVYDLPVLYNKFFLLSHRPPEFTMNDMPWCWLYGHVHNSESYQTVTARTACVCVERWDYQPVELETLIGLMEENSK